MTDELVAKCDLCGAAKSPLSEFHRHVFCEHCLPIAYLRMVKFTQLALLSTDDEFERWLTGDPQEEEW